jgi:hypothetical protein
MLIPACHQPLFPSSLKNIFVFFKPILKNQQEYDEKLEARAVNFREPLLLIGGSF